MFYPKMILFYDTIYKKKRKVRFTMLRLSTRHEFHINPSISDKHYDYGFSCNTTKYEINKLVLKE